MCETVENQQLNHISFLKNIKDVNTEEDYPKFEDLKFEDLAPLSFDQRRRLVDGEIAYIDHPTKGKRKVDYMNVLINTFELTDEEKEWFEARQ